MTDTVHLGLPAIEAAQAQKHVTHNEALAVLDALVMLAAIDRDLSAPPPSPAEGDRYLVSAPGTGAFAGKDNQIAHYLDGSWSFHAPAVGWTCYVADETVLLAWDGTAWQAVGSGGGGGGGPITELQNLARLGLGTTADATNPFAARLNNVLWTAKPVADGGDGHLRCKLSKESVDKTLSFLFQDNFSGRAEIGLAGDDDFHFKVSADGSAWTDALVIGSANATARFAAGVCLTGIIAPAQITADQNDYNPAGLAGASVLRLSSDASRNITGLASGADGRIVIVHNVGAQNIVLKDESAASTAANRFALAADLTLTGDAVAILQYDATSSRWRAVSGGGGGTADAVLYTAQSLSAAQKDQALANLGLPPSSLPLGLRNRWINGSFAIDQRNAGAARTITAGAALAYTVDRWYAYCTGANVTGQRVAGTSSQYRYRFTGAASVTKIGFAQRIEAANIAHLAGQTVTLAADLANSLLTTVTWTAWRGSAADTFGTLASPARTQIATGTFTVSGTEARYSAQISLPAEAANGVEIEFSVGAQTSGTWHIGRAQLEAGGVATPFEVPLTGTEIGNCHRYYRRFRAPVNNASIVVCHCYSTTAALGAWPFSPTMFAPPTLGYSAVGDWALIAPAAGSALPLTALSLNGPTVNSTRIDCTVASGLGGAGTAALFQAANTNAWLEFDAEMKS